MAPVLYEKCSVAKSRSGWGHGNPPGCLDKQRGHICWAKFAELQLFPVRRSLHSTILHGECNSFGIFGSTTRCKVVAIIGVAL